MTCEACRIPVGAQVILAGGSTCYICNTDLSHLHPRIAVYNGIVIYQHPHEFRLLEPIECPGCGHSSQFSYQDCGNDGEVIQLPILLNLEVTNDLE